MTRGGRVRVFGATAAPHGRTIMYVIAATVFVKPPNVEPFLDATLDNARHTRKEPGNLRFDVLRAEDDPTRFLLY